MRNLFHGNRLRQIPRLIHICAFNQGLDDDQRRKLALTARLIVCGVSNAQGDKPVEVATEVLKVFNNLVSSHNQISRFAVVDERPRTALGKSARQQLPAIFDQFEITGKA